MTLEIITIPCLADNYAFLLHDADNKITALVDAPESYPIDRVLEANGWNLDMILITHHHADHIDGIDELRDKYGAKVIGAKADAHRLPALDQMVSEGDSVVVGGCEGKVFDVSGHTVGHIAFHFPDAKAVFTADSLMALGCGRLFEGTAEMMWESLSKLSALPQDTLVYSGHEYTMSNAKFALTIEPDNSELQTRSAKLALDRSNDIASVPSLLSLELETNPFLRANLPEVKTAIGMQDATDVEVFAEIRSRKDNF